MAPFFCSTSLVIFAVRARAGELDAVAQAVFDQPVVDEFAAVVHVQRSQGKGQAEADSLECLYNEAAFSDDEWRRFGPSAGDVGQHQAVNIAAAVDRPAMGHQIHFHAAWDWLVPISKSSQRHAPAWLGLCATRLLHTRRAARRTQQSVDRGCTHRQDLRADRLIELQVSITFQSRQQNGQQCFQALTADPIRRFPQRDQGHACRVVVQRGSSASPVPLGGGLSIQHTDRRLLVIPRCGDKLSENLALLSSARRSIALPAYSAQSEH